MTAPPNDETWGDEHGSPRASPRLSLDRIGKYQLERPLASGGMGEIWVAHDERLQRKVALKLMHRDVHEGEGEGRLERFEHEAQMIARLQHPNVVQVYDHGVAEDGTPFIVMELLEGEDLAAILRRRPRMPLHGLVPLVVQAAKGLQSAHRAKIIHRDLKPANLFLARQGNERPLKILDFGIASVRQAALTNTGEGSFISGTPSYMSPEQAQGTTVDHRSDLWSLGVVTYEALTGMSPFADPSSINMMSRIVNEAHRPPSEIVERLGPSIDRFFERALAKDPNDRFSSALQFAAAFSALMSTQEQRSVTILIVDDEPDLEVLMRQRFRRQVRANRYELLFARSGDEALEELRLRPDVDVVLTDLNMPGMDGLTLLDKLGRAGPALRAVVISAYGDMANIRAAMNAGAYDFLTKPLDFADLEATVEKAGRDALELRRALRSIEENDALRLFVDDEIVDRLLPILRISSEVAAETIDATVVSIAVCNAGEREQPRSASAVFERLNRCFDVIVPMINTWEGAVIRFMGHALLAVFQGEDHLIKAAGASFAIRSALSEAMNGGGGDAGEVCGVSVGLDSGAVLSGSVGSKTIQRLDYTVLGPVVALARSLEAIAERGQILVSETTAIKLAPFFKCRKLEGQSDLGPTYTIERSHAGVGIGGEELTPTVDHPKD